MFSGYHYQSKGKWRTLKQIRGWRIIKIIEATPKGLDLNMRIYWRIKITVRLAWTAYPIHLSGRQSGLLLWNLQPYLPLMSELRHLSFTVGGERWGSCTHKGRSSSHRSRAAPRRDTGAPTWWLLLQNTEPERTDWRDPLFSLALRAILDPNVDAPHGRYALGSHPIRTRPVFGAGWDSPDHSQLGNYRPDLGKGDFTSWKLKMLI